MVVVECLKLEIINVLVHRRGIALNEAINRVSEATVHYDKEIHDIIDVLIAECPYKGLPMVFDRPPSMQQGAIQLYFLTRVILDHVTRLSPMDLKAQNADLTIGPYHSNVDTISSLIAGNPRSIWNHNVTGNGRREGLRIHVYVAISSEIP
jgi:hypothetical protein